MADQVRRANYQELVQQGQRAYHALQLNEALQTFERATALDAQGYDAHLGLARTLIRMQRVERALEAAQKCLALDDKRPEAHAVLGTLYFLQDRLAEAVAALQKAIELNPEDAEPHLTLSQVYADLKQFEEAAAELERGRELIAALRDEKQRMRLLALAWHVEAYMHLARGEDAEAAECAQQVIALEEANPHAACLAYSNLGILEARARRYDQAIEYLERAYQMNPSFQRAGAALGRLLILRGRTVRAAEVLGQVLSVAPPTNGSTRYAYAMALARTGRRAEALEQYRRALAEGLTGADVWIARWQTVWLSVVGRYIVIGVLLAAVFVWLVAFKPSPQAVTLLLLVALILVLRQTIGRRR